MLLAIVASRARATVPEATLLPLRFAMFAPSGLSDVPEIVSPAPTANSCGSPAPLALPRPNNREAAETFYIRA